jgi:hypothetical protein
MGCLAGAGSLIRPCPHCRRHSSSRHLHTPCRRSVCWLDPCQRGEGLNLADFGAFKYGPSFTIETGMRTGFGNRVRTSVLAAQTAIEVFEERYA